MRLFERKICPAIVFTIFFSACVSGFSIVTSNFTSGGGGDWHNAGNWDAGVPNGIDDQAIMLANPGGTVSVTGAVATIGLLRSSSDSDYSISTPLVFDVSVDSAAIEMGIANTGAMTLSGSITLDSSLDISISRPTPGDLTISGNIAGNGGLSCSGTNTGQLFLTGTNSYLGSTSFTNKTVNINSSNSIPSGSTVNFPTGSVAVVKATAAGITLGSPIVCAGSSPTINNNGNIFTLSGALSGSLGANLQTTGAGTVSITGTSTTLPITVNQGTLALSTTGDLSGSAVTLVGSSILDITAVSGASGTIGSLNGPSGTSAVIGAKTLTMNPTSGLETGSFAGVISGVGGSLTLSGAVIQALSGVNTYNGATTLLSGAELQISSASTIAASSLIDITDSILTCTGTFSISNPINGTSQMVISVPSGTITLPSPIGGAPTLFQKNGNGTLLLSSTGTVPATAQTAVGAGTLRAGSADVLASAQRLSVSGTFDTNSFNQSVGDLDSGASGQILLGSSILTVNSTLGGTSSGVISGSTGSLVKTGASSLSLGGLNTYGGGTTINDGGLTITVSNGLPIGGNVVVNDPGLLSMFGTTQSVGNLSGSGLLFLGAGSLTVTPTLPSSYSGVISGTSSSSLIKAGAVTFTLTAANTFSGTTTINNGTLALSGSGALSASGTVNVNSSTSILDVSGVTVSTTIGNLTGVASSSVVLGTKTLTCGSSASSTFPGIISGVGGSLTKTGTGTLTLSGVNTYTGTTTITNGTLALSGSGALASTGTVNVNSATSILNVSGVTTSTIIGNLSGVASSSVVLGSKTLTCGTSSSSTFAGIVSGVGGSLTKAGTGTLTLSGTNTYSGSTTINAGTVSISGSSNLGTSAVSVGATGTLLGTGGTYTLSNNMSLAGGSTISVTATQMTASGVISGVGGSLTKTGAGILVVSGSNTYDGGTTISAGTLTTGANNVMPSGGAVAVTGTFNLNNTLQSIGNLTGAGPTTLGTGTLTVSPASSSTYSGVISGVGGSLVKGGSSTQILTGVNTYNAGTSITGGTLSISGSSNVGTGAVSIGSAGTLQGTGATYTLANNISVASGSTIDVTATQMTASGLISGASGSLTKTGSGTLLVSGANTYDGGSIIGAGTLKAGANNAIPTGSDVSVSGVFDVDTTTQSIGNLTGSGSTNIGAAGLLTITPSSNLTYAGTLTGAGAVSKQGSSLLELTGNSTSFTGLCTVGTGELKLNGTLGSGGAGAVSVDAGAILSGNATIGGALTNHGTVSPGNSVGTMVVGSLVLGTDSILDVDINDALQSDVFTVSPGTATIDGALNVNFLPGVYTAGSAYTIVNAAAGVSGTFASVTDNSPEFNIDTAYTGTMVTLTIVSPGGSVFFNLPFTGNAKAVANNINAISSAGTLTTDPDLNHAVEVLVGQSFDVISDALLRLDPTPYTTIGAASALASPILAEIFAGKKRKSCCPSRYGCEDGKWSVWADPFVMHLDQGSIGSQEGFDALASGFALGAERGLSKEWKVGIGFAYDHLSIDYNKHRGSSECNDSYLALFADGEGKQWHFACAVLGGVDVIANERKIQYLSINSKAHSDYCAGELIGQASGAFFLGPKTRQFQFYGSVTSDTLFQPAIHEHGAGGLNLKIRGKTSSAFLSQAGVLLKQRKEFADGCWGPDFWVGYVNEVFLTTGKLRSNFVNQVIPFTTIGVHKSQNLMEVGLSMTLLLNKGFSFIGTYSSQIGAKLVTQNGDLRFRWMF